MVAQTALDRFVLLTPPMGQHWTDEDVMTGPIERGVRRLALEPALVNRAVRDAVRDVAVSKLREWLCRDAGVPPP